MALKKGAENEGSQSNCGNNMEAERKLSLEEKLDLIDEEFHKLHMFCVKSGYSPEQVAKFAEPFSNKVKVASRKKWLKRLLGFLMFSLALWPLFNTDSVHKFVCTVGRRAAIQIMPLYDWSKLYYVDCLIDNPLHESQIGLKVGDCNACENVNQINRIRNVGEADLMQKYIKQERPVIVEDGVSEGQKFSVQLLAKIFEESLFDSCEFNSNIKTRGHRTFLKQAAAREHQQYFAYWKNCFEEPAKELRLYFKRPYFFSSIVEIAETSWIFISNNYTAKMAKPVLVDGPLVVLMQMKGSVEIVVSPDTVCSDICTELREVLHEGEILLVNDYLWIIDYYPAGEGESVGIGLTASFD